MTSQLDQLKKVTTVVADSGDFSSFKELKPQDATTNPSLLLAAAQMQDYAHLVKVAIDYAKEKGGSTEEQVKLAMDKLAVTVGAEILKLIPGRVSTELDARLSYDTQGCIDKCHEIKKLYEEIGIDVSKRVLFKIASTWEGIKAAEQLGVTLISPFVGRILDFWKKEKGVSTIPIEEDPGVDSVKRIFNYYKKFGYKTIVMGASFRTKEEILALAGCDYLTISPNFLHELSKSTDNIVVQLSEDKAKEEQLNKISLDEKQFRWLFGKDPCGTVKLAEGIVKFADDTEKLEKFLEKKLTN